MRRIFFIFFIIFFAPLLLKAQDNADYGVIISVSGKNAMVQFENQTVSVGDEVEFWRFASIVDPTSGIERGKTRNLVGRGIIDEIGLGKANVTITEFTVSGRLLKTDRAHATGTKKKMTRKIGRIQEITADNKEMTIDLGSEDEISEGDSFLIQRTENIYDPKTNKVTGTNQIDIGRGMVNTVKNRSSTAIITAVESGREVLKTDTVVFSEEKNRSPAEMDVPESMRNEIDRLKSEIESLKATVDSLGAEHSRHLEEFLVVKHEIDSLLPLFMNLDAKADNMIIGKAETILKKSGDQGLLPLYRHALNTCLKGRFDQAENEFRAVMDRYPDSWFVENCRYWIAQCRFAKHDYSSASSGFQSVMDDTRFSHKDDDASLMLGLSYFQTGKVREAIEHLHNFLESYKKSEYRGKAEQWLERMSLIKTRE